jgi:ABC-2 type transport system permease protein
MRNPILQVFRYELRRNVRRKGYLFSTFGLPLLAIIILFVIQAISNANAAAEQNQTEIEGNTPIPDMPGVNIPGEGMEFDGVEKAGYVDQSGLFGDPGDLVERLIPYADETTAAMALQAGEIDAYYVIAEDYLDSGDVTLVLPTLSLTQIDSGLITQLILNTLAGDVEDENLFTRLLDPSNVESENLARGTTENVEGSFDSRFILVYVFTLALMLTLFMTNGYLMQGLIEEKENRVVEILLSSLRPSQLLIGKILAFGLLGLLQMLVWLGAFMLLLNFANLLPTISVLANIYMPLDILPLVFVYFLLAYLFFATGYGMVGALATSAREGPQYAVVFTLPAVLPLYFLSIFLTAPDATLPVVLSLIPITAPIAMVMRLLITTVPAWQIILSLGLLILTILGMMWLAGRLFRVQTLLAGQTPKLRDLPRIVRG